MGVNSYVSVRLSFLPDDEATCTRVAARTFCPEFDHHAEVRCDALVRKSGGEICSLAEQLAEAWAVFTVWNKDNRKGGVPLPPSDSRKVPTSVLLELNTYKACFSSWSVMYGLTWCLFSVQVLPPGLRLWC